MNKHASTPNHETRPARRGLETATWLVLALGLPLLLGARGCEQVVVGHECDGEPCPEGGAGSAAGQGGAGQAGGAEQGGAGASGGVGGGEQGGAGASGGVGGGEQGGAGASGGVGGGEQGGAGASGGVGGGEQGGAGASGGVGGGEQGGAGASGGVGGGEQGGAGASGGAGGATGSGQTCGGIASLECPSPNEFCNYEPSAGGQGCVDIADAAGVCQTQPRGCTREYQPVCSCDRRSYSNACEAHSAGASILHDGACTEVDCKAIGGRAVDGFGPPPMCAANEVNFTWLVYSTGGMSIEGTACCVPQ
jgi:hypothetical protein